MNYDLGPQKQPNSIFKIEAETKFIRRTMNELREKVLLATKKELSEKPFVDGRRVTIIGSMRTMFEGCSEDEIEEGMMQLGKDLNKFNLRLCSFPEHPEFLCAEEFEQG